MNCQLEGGNENPAFTANRQIARAYDPHNWISLNAAKKARR
jgi:hypothetical protein